MKIREANDRFAKDFLQWIDVVGAELKRAQTEKSKPGSHESEFGDWVLNNTPWTHNYANRVIQAHDLLNLLMPIGTGKLPANEAQCRELACVPKDKQPEVWRAVLDRAGDQPITAGLIRGETAEYREPSEEVPIDKQWNAMRERIRKWVEQWGAETPIAYLQDLLRELRRKRKADQ